MDLIFQALVMGVVQGLTEFLPVSSSAHLIIVPFLFGWEDSFIDSLAFGVMLHLGTLAALLLYYGHDWLRIVPAGFAAVRDRSFRDDPDRRLAWLIVAATIPAAVIGAVFNNAIDTSLRGIGLVAVMLVVGAAILALADRWGGTSRRLEQLTFPVAAGIGFAQVLALVPGISRSGISISAGRVANLDRASAARFSFLMATPITAGAIIFEARKLLTGEAGVTIDVGPLIVGLIASFVSGLIAIRVLMDYVRTRSLDIFVWYRVGLAVLLVVVWLAR
jgi:undecaprenyl-diphosphatase